MAAAAPGPGLSVTTYKVLSTFALPSGYAVAMAVNQRAGSVFVTSTNALTEISGSTGKVIANVSVAARPVTVDPATRNAYVGRYGAPDVLAFHSNVG